MADQQTASAAVSDARAVAAEEAAVWAKDGGQFLAARAANEFCNCATKPGKL